MSVKTILVSRADVIKTLKVIKSVYPKKNPPQAVIYCLGDHLTFQVGGTSSEIAIIEGHFYGQARLPIAGLLRLISLLPETDPLPIVQSENKISFGNISFQCVWEGLGIQVIKLPVNASLRQILALPFAFTEEEIEKAGLSKIYHEAEKRKSHLIQLAANNLEQIGISFKELEVLVNQSLRKEAEQIFIDK